MNLINIKPLSVNNAWKGRRFKTKAYKEYEKELLLLLPKINVPEGKLNLHLIFAFSSRSADLDNPEKLFIDVLQRKYNFDDKMIYKITLEKEIVKKGSEYIKFKIGDYAA